MIKNYIFDFGNVIIKFDPYYMASAFIDDEKDIETVAKVVFDRLYWKSLDDGTISDPEVKSAICSRLEKRLHEKACLVYDNWHKNLPFIDGMVSLIDDIKASGGRLFLLSNISCGFAEKYAEVPEFNNLFQKFDGLVFSGPLGIVKPHAPIFEHLLNKYSLKADECLFIDDTLDNVEGAKAVGVHTYHFKGDSEHLRSFLDLTM